MRVCRCTARRPQYTTWNDYLTSRVSRSVIIAWSRNTQAHAAIAAAAGDAGVACDDADN